MAHMLAMAAKDLRILFRIKSGVFFAFVWPVIMAIMFGLIAAGQGGGPARLRVAVVDDDNSEPSRAFIAALDASGDFVVDRATRADAEVAVRRGQRSAFLVIKPGFGVAAQQMFYGQPKQIEIGIDPARQAETSMIEGLVTKHAMSDLQNLFNDPAASRKMVNNALSNLETAGNAPPVAPLKRFLGELDTFLGAPQAAAPGGGDWQPVQITTTAIARERRGPTNSFDVTFPQGIVWGIIGCVMTFAVGLVSERMRGTYVRLQMAPVTRAQILGGKALACFATITAVQVMLLTIGVTGFGLRIGSPLLLAVACVAASLGFVGFMMMIASLGTTEQAVAGAGWAMLMPMAMIGGAMMPAFLLPGWLQTFGNISPIKWAILALEGAIWRDFTAAEMLPPVGTLLVFGAVCFAIGTRGLKD